MKKYFPLFSLIPLLVFIARSQSEPQDTWANWNKRLERAYEDINPIKVRGPMMGLLVPYTRRTDILPMSAFGYEILAQEKMNTIVFLIPLPADSAVKGLLTTNMEFIESSFGNFPVDTVLLSELKTESDSFTIDNAFFYPKVPADLEIQLANLKFILKGKVGTVKILPLFLKFDDLNSAVKDIAPLLAEKIKDDNMTSDVTFVMASDLTENDFGNSLISSDNK